MTVQQGNSNMGRRRRFDAGNDNREHDHEVLEVARVVRVVKGGRRFRFRASVVIGNRQGEIGLGTSKSRDVQQAIQKAQDQAKKNIVKISLNTKNSATAIKVKHKGAVLLLKKATPGTGIISGGVVRMVASLAGIKDLVSKQYGSANKISNAKAAIDGLTKLYSNSVNKR